MLNFYYISITESLQFCYIRGVLSHKASPYLYYPIETGPPLRYQGAGQLDKLHFISWLRPAATVRRRPAGPRVSWIKAPASWDGNKLEKLDFRSCPEILIKNFFNVTLFGSWSHKIATTNFQPAKSCAILDEIENIRNGRKPSFRRRDFSEQILENQKKFFKKFFQILDFILNFMYNNYSERERKEFPYSQEIRNLILDKK